jgi:hypothetical protein
MLNGDLYIAERTMGMHVDRELREAEASRLLRQARAKFPPVLAKLGSRFLSGFGKRLVALGTSSAGSIAQ